jgi:purine catabolism regulator
MLPTIADVIALPAVVAGRPIVVTGEHKLTSPVRWVHMAPPEARLLIGGELLLSTGDGWPNGRRELRAYVQQFAELHIVGLILELGTRYAEPPDMVVEAFQDFDIPLIALRKEVRFVSITEAVHSLIIDRQTGALRERDRIHGIFADLNRRNCSTEFLLQQVARILKKPVVLEDLNHRVITWHAPFSTPRAVLSDWITESRKSEQRSVSRPEPYSATRHWREGGWLRTAVEARGHRWGSLVALDCVEVPHVAEVVLENAALALSIARLSDPDDDDWVGLGQRRLLSDLLTGSFLETNDLKASFEASGFAVDGRTMFAAARRGRERNVPPLLRRMRRVASGLGVDVLAGAWSEAPQTTALFVVSFNPARRDHEDVIMKLCATGDDREFGSYVLAIGAPASDVTELLASAEEALNLLVATPAASANSSIVRRSRSVALDILITRRRTDPAMQNYVERMLGPVLAYETAHKTDLLSVVEALVQHPTNRTKAAAASNLSRSVFYERLQLIESMLDIPLDDGNNLAALHVALLAYGRPKGR